MTDPKDPTKEQAFGMRKGLTDYGDADFSLFLRRAFIKGAGYTEEALSRPVVAIANTGSCLLYTSPSPRDRQKSRMPSSA